MSSEKEKASFGAERPMNKAIPVWDGFEFQFQIVSYFSCTIITFFRATEVLSEPT
jgi:hypothetical protein